MTNSYKKEYPLAGFPGFGGGAGALAFKSASSKTYIDDVFSTNAWEGASGSDTPVTVTNGIDLTEGGLVWLKMRGVSYNHGWYDTVRGVQKEIASNSSAGQSDEIKGVTSFNSNGFTAGGRHNQDYEPSARTFRKAKGFFDIVEYTGTGNVYNVPHNLGCVPGCVMIKKTSATDNWSVYHRGLDLDNPEQWWISLNLQNGRMGTSGTTWNNTKPTSTHFTIGSGDQNVNTSGATYIAYVFAGGASTAATARSVQLDGSGDWFTTSTSSDYAFGTGDFTVEHWINLNGSASGQPTILDARTTGSYTTQWVTYFDTDYTYNFYALGANRLKTSKLARNTWNHIALVRSSGVTRLYLNGTSQGAYTDTNNYSMTSIVFGANAVNFGHNTNGRLSNLRVVKGTAVYTSSFKPPTEPLKNITNTKLLCFNNSSTTGTTVGTITASGDPTAITDSPFDDPAGFKFGEEGDQNIIKCGTYKALGGTWNLNLGWEPQWILIKNDGNQNWTLVDAIRGMAWDDVSQGTGYDEQLHPNTNSAENNRNICDAIPNGIRISSVEDIVNGGSQNYYYIAIRRSDGYVGKPFEAGDANKVFAMDVGNGSSTIPCFDSGFPVDFIFQREPASGNHWRTSARLMGPRYLNLDGTDAESGNSNYVYDSNVGALEGWSSNKQAWMFKRHAGFDVVTYTGNGLANHDIPHSLNRVPDMIWIKPTDEVLGWICGHSGLNSGVNPWHYYFYMNYPWASTDSPTWNDQAPTSTHFSVNGQNHGHNNSGQDHVAFLWSNITGISKCGYYIGNGSTQTITTGFQPRFLWFMRDNGNGGRYVLDTTRGWAGGNDQYLQMDTSAAQSAYDIGAPTSTGFTLTNDSSWNGNTLKYIYFAHA